MLKTGVWDCIRARDFGGWEMTFTTKYVLVRLSQWIYALGGVEVGPPTDQRDVSRSLRRQVMLEEGTAVVI